MLLMFLNFLFFRFPFSCNLNLKSNKEANKELLAAAEWCGGKNSWKGKFYGNSSAIYHSTLTVQFSYQLEWEQLKNLRVKNKIRKKRQARKSENRNDSRERIKLLRSKRKEIHSTMNENFLSDFPLLFLFSYY